MVLQTPVLLLIIIVIISVGLHSSNACQWSAWSETYSCQWINKNCLNGYFRHCICPPNRISRGDLCGNSNFYIETKPFVSNFHAPSQLCSRQHCPTFSNWCSWQPWSYWKPVTNSSCHRKRTRKCCQSRPQYGGTLSKNANKGCFVNNTSIMPHDSQEQIREMQCSTFTEWLWILMYVGIGIGVFLLIITICLCSRTKSTKEEKIYKQNQNFIFSQAPVRQTAQVFQPEVDIAATAPQELIENVPQSSAPILPRQSTTNIPVSPPAYHEVMQTPRSSSAQQVTEPSSKNKSVFFNPEESTGNFIEDQFLVNNVGLPIDPPSYSVYSRNPNLFEESCSHV